MNSQKHSHWCCYEELPIVDSGIGGNPWRIWWRSIIKSSWHTLAHGEIQYVFGPKLYYLAFVTIEQLASTLQAKNINAQVCVAAECSQKFPPEPEKHRKFQCFLQECIYQLWSITKKTNTTTSEAIYYQDTSIKKLQIINIKWQKIISGSNINWIADLIKKVQKWLDWNCPAIGM